ncbi:putative sodium bile acid cotransporter, partial [Zychaea mexicana]|uniref:putative sodium bile acid cotransporter n=1 Tax=Zychaea mexicana TaxID=64656 RepID=UPI0022FDB616
MHKKLNATNKTAKSLFIKYWFLLGLAFVIGMAWLFPDVGKANGTIQAQYTVKWGAVIVIFLLSGLGIDVRVMLKTILRWRLHLVIQVINFLVLPFLMYAIVLMLITANAKIDNSVYKGWMIALSTSTTVSSNVVMTRNAKGNDSGALFNAAFGNILGIFICPALMTVFQQDARVFPPGTPHGNPDYVNILRNLGFTVLLPLVVGQLVRYRFSEPVKKIAAKLRFPIINNLALLCLVWSVFCDGVASNAFDQMTAVDIVSIVFVDIFMYVFGCALCLFVARAPWPSKFVSEPQWISQWRFGREDTVAIMYCGATKTVSMGIPLINVLYSQNSYGVVGVLSLPLLLYHIIQLFIGNFQVQILKRWIVK